MKKLILSLAVIIFFAFYAFWSTSRTTTLAIATPTKTELTVTPAIIPTPTAKAAPVSPGIPNMLTTSATTKSTGKFKNGTYTGPVADVYYGNVEVKATISGGKLTDVQFLQYPMDRQTSLQKSTHAMPILKSEAIVAQSAKVDGVSGATETSKGFIASLGGALAQAAI